ncbi:HAD-IA family hydrolase [Corynebacterium felinum]|uniref:HAD superfamily hydrolase (TIGR01549 family) n=1 Tax=Corynebacterium felinum TaxID=131318 RepID=A0ABU2BCB1_9CORY|nr:HAD-IA family hydrolase [Corynebacterium felinum]MDF5821205.1 HAD-IA family hydrolase [Corynebacterium felinum]MDR7356277.1 HAD superfamily hydrolase (TIGR01549 family) [Corynebacterium felinum]WJY95610.1 5'-nucleotidase [Corynebacterium felinum]
MALLIFDIDGTLIDSQPGIEASIRRTLSAYSIPHPEPDWFRSVLGPKIEHTFASLGLGADAVAHYREHYVKNGISQARLYPGIAELLAELVDAGHTLATASNKQLTTAHLALDHFDIKHHFSHIGGTTPTLNSKAAIIGDVLSQLTRHDTTVMIGDRLHDVEGARSHSIPTIVVGWGYGNANEWSCGEAFAPTVADLRGLIP